MAEWPCCHDPLRFSPMSLRFVPPPFFHLPQLRCEVCVRTWHDQNTGGCWHGKGERHHNLRGEACPPTGQYLSEHRRTGPTPSLKRLGWCSIHCYTRKNLHATTRTCYKAGNVLPPSLARTEAFVVNFFFFIKLLKQRFFRLEELGKLFFFFFG